MKFQNLQIKSNWPLSKEHLLLPLHLILEETKKQKINKNHQVICQTKLCFALQFSLFELCVNNSRAFWMTEQKKYQDVPSCCMEWCCSYCTFVQGVSPWIETTNIILRETKQPPYWIESIAINIQISLTYKVFSITT